MSFNTTVDNVVYSQSTQPENIAEKPFIKKEWTNPIFDSNTSANYASNQIIFDTTTLSNSGQFVNYAEGLIMLPLVVRLSGKNAGADVDMSAAGYNSTDFVLGLKNSHVQLLHSLSITLNNIDILQNVPLLNSYLTFRQHTELSSDDEFLNCPLTGYAKDNSSSWYYNAPTAGAGNFAGMRVGDTRGVGIGNNCNMGLLKPLSQNDDCNEGLLKRQKLVNKINTEKQAVLGNETAYASDAKSYVKTDASGKYYFYDVCLRLKDICPDLFNNLPMAVGLKFKFTLTLNNNVSFRFAKNAAGNLIFDPVIKNVTSQTNPFMIASSYNTYVTQAGSNVVASTVNNADSTNDNNAAGSFSFTAADVASNQCLAPCGSSTLPASDDIIYTVESKLGELGTGKHIRPQCVLYVPSYTLNSKYEEEYLAESNRIRKIHYTELEYQVLESKQGGQFASELSSSCVRPKRLIMIPFLTAGTGITGADGNGLINPLSSPFTCEPATTSPVVLSSFNCSISNVNIYPNDISYSYDHFLQELNGQQGINGNIVNGLCSGRINMTDYQNIYHYIVCDLSRRMPSQDMLSVSVRVRGTVRSPKAIEFHCYIEKERVIELDIITGKLINRY